MPANQKLPLNLGASCALPEQVRELVAALIEGRLTSLVFVATGRNETMTGVFPQIDGAKTNLVPLIGAVEVVKTILLDAALGGEAPNEEDED